MSIAFFDSGIGGITVLKKAVSLIPGENFIYYADTQNVPYGVKHKDEVRKYIIKAVEFLSAMDIQALVIACNTATSIAISELRDRFDFPILGMEPAIKPAILNNTGKKILVTATSLTLQESKLETLIKALDKNQRIVKLALDRLVEYAEIFDFSSSEIEIYLKEKLREIKSDEYETIVLGCTHFIYYRKMIKKIVGEKTTLIDGNDGTVRNLMNTLATYSSTTAKKNKKSSTPTQGGPFALSPYACRSMARHQFGLRAGSALCKSKSSCANNASKITFYSSGVEDSAERVNKLLELMTLL